MAEITNNQIGKLARALTVPRQVFAAAYDDFARNNRSKRFMLIAEERNQREPLPLGPERDAEDYLDALIAARQAGWLVEFVFEKFHDLSSGAPAEATVELQAIANFDQRFVDAADVEIGTLDALRRSCQVYWEEETASGRVRERPLGSGFLVGPHLVMTNSHVVAPLLLGDMPRPGGPRPRVRFDFYAPDKADVVIDDVAAAEDWLLESSPAVDPNDPAQTTGAALGERLDFAILRLDGQPGHARGWYDLRKAPPPPPVGVPVEVWQFPKASPMQVVSNNVVPPQAVDFSDLAPTQVPPRIFYAANTLDGASGALVLNAEREPVALHEAGLPDSSAADPKPNRGIPLIRIAEAVSLSITQELRNLHPMTGWHSGLRRPILGRNRLQAMVHAANHGEARILAVMTQPDRDTADRVPNLGRSFTRRIIEALLPDGPRVAVFSAAQVQPNPFATAEALLRAVDPARDPRLSPPSGETTLDAEATGHLVEEVIQGLRAAARGNALWVLIDDIDAHPIGTQWSSSSFLTALYRRVAGERLLRIVLCGLPRPLEGLRDLEEDGAWLVEALDAPPSDGDIETWLEAHLADRAWPAEFAVRLRRLVRSVAATAPHAPACPTEAAAEVLAQHALAAFRQGDPRLD